MSMEERLRASFEQEAERLHAPHGSPETAIRRGRRRRASNLIGGAALVLVLVGGTAAGVQLLGSGDEPDQTATDTTVTTGERTSQQAAAGVTDFVWEQVTLPRPDGTSVWTAQVMADGDGFTAVGIANSVRAGSGEQILVWQSADGTDWTLASAASPFDGSVESIFTTGEGFIAIARSFDGTLDRVGIYRSPDALTWTRDEVDLRLAEDQFVWFAGAASGNGVTVLAGSLQTEMPQPPIVLEDQGVVLQQSNRDGTITVSDRASGEVITVVDASVVFGDGTGLSLYGDDGRLILAIDYEEIDRAEAAGHRTGTVLTIEKDGVRLALDDADYTYLATDLATGDPIASGSQEKLYQPARIRITDPDTGAVIVDIDADKFYAAQERSWSSSGPGYSQQTEAVVLVSDGDGSWEQTELATAAGELNVAGVGFGGDGFLVSVDRYGSTSFGQDVWRSPNGTDWELASSSEIPGSGLIATFGEDYYRLSYGRQSGVSRSSDGSTWTSVYEADRPGTYYTWLAAGELGLVAVGQFQEDSFGPPVVLAKDGRTLVVDGQTGRITVTDDATGQVLTVIELNVYDVNPPEQIITDAETGMITVTDADGNALMQFTEEEADAASSERAVEYPDSLPEPAIAFSRDGETWFTATTVGLDIVYPTAAAVGDGAVVVMGESADTYGATYGSDGEVTIELSDGSTETATTVVGAEYYAPNVYLWVGRPR